MPKLVPCFSLPPNINMYGLVSSWLAWNIKESGTVQTLYRIEYFLFTNQGLLRALDKTHIIIIGVDNA